MFTWLQIGSSLHYASLEGDLDIVKYVYNKNELDQQIQSVMIYIDDYDDALYRLTTTK